MFDRRDKSHAALVEDVDCIGELERTDTPKIPFKQSCLYEYRFDPDQDYVVVDIETTGGWASEDRITFYPGSVDAMNVPAGLKGLRTLFTSFHHFPPHEARAILQNAVDAGEGIGIFEITQRAPLTIGLMFAWALMPFACTPWIRPFRWSRLLWTYLIPIIPLVLLFDGVVSCLRTYRPQELRDIVEKLTSCQYQWEIGELATGKMPVTYLIGYAKSRPMH